MPELLAAGLHGDARMDSIRVRYGDLGRVYGRLSRTEDFVFCPADIDSCNWSVDSKSCEFFLADQAAPTPFPDLRRAIGGKSDISWTVARGSWGFS